jgi:hypothetical protein
MATVLRRAGLGLWQVVASAQRHFQQKGEDSDADGDLDRVALDRVASAIHLDDCGNQIEGRTLNWEFATGLKNRARSPDQSPR